MKNILFILLALFLTGCASKYQKTPVTAIHHCHNGYCTAVLEHVSGNTFIKYMKNPEVGDLYKLHCEDGVCKLKED